MADQAPPAVIRSTKSAVERTRHTRKKPRRQAIVILQHENMRTNASELGFHGLHIPTFRRLGNVLPKALWGQQKAVIRSNIPWVKPLLNSSYSSVRLESNYSRHCPPSSVGVIDKIPGLRYGSSQMIFLRRSPSAQRASSLRQLHPEGTC
ncbi:hypothetical protein AB9E02_05895 [Rhizobium leguminosarum]